MIHTGDAIEVMRGLPEASVDAVCTDPPYALAFMSKHWDAHPSPKSFQAWCTQWGAEALRVTVPGGYLLAFGGTRTHHRLVCGLEDAGWIIRDELDWIYASGFPKGKANLKPAHEPIVLARKPGPLRPLAIDACRIPGAEPYVYPNGPQGNTFSVAAAPDGSRTEPVESNPSGRWPSNVLLSDPELFDVANPEVVGSGAVSVGMQSQMDLQETPSNYFGADKHPGFREGYGDTGGYSRFFIIPKADRADREPVLRGQVGKRNAGSTNWRYENDGAYEVFVHEAPEGIGAWLREQREAAGLTRKQVAAHFPSRTGNLTGCVTNWEEEFNRPTADQWIKLREVIGFDDRYDTVMINREPSGYVKPEKPTSKRENAHPTVKPVDLMRHLVRLVTPTGGTVLDPFLGSGSTAIACEMEGFAWIGIEKELEYTKIAEARLNGVQKGLGLDVPAPTRVYQPNTNTNPARFQGTSGGSFSRPYGNQLAIGDPEDAA